MLRLKLVRIAARLTQVSLARAADMSQTRVSLIERGLIPVSVEEREKLAAALAVSPSALFRSVPRQGP